jgi:integrase
MPCKRQTSTRRSGQARVLTDEQQQQLFEAIQHHRHPEKNTAIMQISFKLGLRAQEIALLQIKEVARLQRQGSEYTLLEVMSLPAAYTKGADVMQRSRSAYKRRSLSFDVETFAQVIRQVEALAKAGADIDPTDFHPPARPHKGKSRDLPMVDKPLRAALTDYLDLRMAARGRLHPTDPLFITQKRGPYSPNTLQEHMAVMLRDWAGIEKSSSHSGRRSLLTNVIHKQKKSVKVAQKIAGHVSPATTLIYEEPPEEQLAEALKNL